MSLIFLATTGELERPKPSDLVALKIANVDSEHRQFYVATLDNEVEHLRKLQHPGIVRLYRIQGQTLPPNPIYSAQTILPGKPWFSVMEYLEGGSLGDLLKRQRRLEVGLALEITLKLAETLAYIHSQGHVHLDIKPENVVFRRPLSDAVEPVLVDFGIARAMGQEGLEAGTLQWSPPERIIHSERKNLPPEMMAKPHFSMDVYALGLLLYRMVAGRLPFEGSRKSITSAILQGNPTRPSTYEAALEPELDRIILAAIAKDPAARPTAEGFAAMVANLAARPKHRSYRLPPPPPADKAETDRRRRAVWPISAVLSLAGLALVLFLWWGNAGAGNGSAAAVTTSTATATATRPPATSTTRRATATRMASREPSATSFVIGTTSTPVPTYTPAPSATAEPSAQAAAPPTGVQPTLTFAPPTRTFAPPTWTFTPPTWTPAPPTWTPAPPTWTPAPPTWTPVPPPALPTSTPGLQVLPPGLPIP
jgi:serine/threonine-protein kinase